MNRTKGTKRTHPKEANGTWTKVNKVHALFTSISSFGSSLFFIYWIKTKEKGVRSLTLFPLVFYSIKEQQRTSEERNGNEGTEARIHFTHLLLSLSSFSLSIKHKRKKRSAWLNLKRKGRTTMASSPCSSFNFTRHLVNWKWTRGRNTHAWPFRSLFI